MFMYMCRQAHLQGAFLQLLMTGISVAGNICESYGPKTMENVQNDFKSKFHFLG